MEVPWPRFCFNQWMLSSTELRENDHLQPFRENENSQSTEIIRHSRAQQTEQKISFLFPVELLILIMDVMSFQMIHKGSLLVRRHPSAKISNYEMIVTCEPDIDIVDQRSM